MFNKMKKDKELKLLLKNNYRFIAPLFPFENGL
jgi:hypothetical protein